ncbi:MAG: autotransporter outer membrane beta-barrel domain-containing protein, partial [Planctomycetes bacterium]|nr:autotransporter outer membrane beta-barrel domain-containing protein [Planctomycetota bacterium]
PAYAGTAKKPFLSSPVWRGESGKAAEAVKSDSAYANLATMTPGVDMVMPGYVCTDFAPKDIRVWGSARYASEKQDPLLYSAYDSTATTWELGFSKDWSIATTLGVSVSLLDAEVKAQGEGDGRKSEVLGYIIDGHMRTAILDRYPLRANFRLGRLENEGKGGYNLSGNNWSWHENKHNATLYGMSALAGLPLTFGDEYKLLLESGFIYNKLDAGSYNARLADPSGLNNDIAFSVEKRQLSSTSIPILATVKKDFIRCYGIITPRATVGIFREFDDSSMGLRAFNASAASSLLGDPASASLSNADDGSGMLYTANVGVDLITGSGWNMHADYEYLTGDEYKRHSFKLELAKCF